MTAERASTLVVASGNPHKVVEIEELLAGAVSGLEVRGQREFGMPPKIEESAPDFEGNAKLKAEGIAAWLRGQGQPGDILVLADDSGVCVDALDGAPGVYSARFAGPDAHDEDNNARLVTELSARGRTSSPAHYVCMLALVRVDGRVWPDLGASVRCFSGRWDVEARVERRGDGGFGYDPHCWLDHGAKTVAELTAEDKNRRSHRGQALRALVAWMRDGGSDWPKGG